MNYTYRETPKVGLSAELRVNSYIAMQWGRFSPIYIKQIIMCRGAGSSPGDILSDYDYGLLNEQGMVENWFPDLEALREHLLNCPKSELC